MKTWFHHQKSLFWEPWLRVINGPGVKLLHTGYPFVHFIFIQYHSLVKKGPWVVHLTLSSERAVGRVFVTSLPRVTTKRVPILTTVSVGKKFARLFDRSILLCLFKIVWRNEHSHFISAETVPEWKWNRNKVGTKWKPNAKEWIKRKHWYVFKPAKHEWTIC